MLEALCEVNKAYALTSTAYTKQCAMGPMISYHLWPLCRDAAGHGRGGICTPSFPAPQIGLLFWNLVLLSSLPPLLPPPLPRNRQGWQRWKGSFVISAPRVCSLVGCLETFKVTGHPRRCMQRLTGFYSALFSIFSSPTSSLSVASLVDSMPLSLLFTNP